MNNEIKEILNQMKATLELQHNLKGVKDSYLELREKEIKTLLDYITNLQKEMETLRSEYIGEKLKNDKAVEYIKEHIKYECDNAFNGMQFYSHHLYDFDKDELLNILRGKN